jgi:hypothetical protein
VTFGLANPYDGPDLTDTAMFRKNVRNRITRFRNYPALAL